MNSSDNEYRNRLANEKSPYLLQHAGNPVDWYPWGPDAFEKAKAEDKPIFLSIGYSTCHWCHVMAHESFEDMFVARLLNQTFVNIKVDREERPDLDALYMTVCQMMTGSGGWPLTVIMTPDRRPFFAGTYYPRETRFGRPGLLDIIPYVREAWTERRGDLLDMAGRITDGLRQPAGTAGGEELGEPLLGQAYEELKAHYDPENAGFGGAPKFPTPHNLNFLLRWWRRSSDAAALDMATATLRTMRNGGMYDQVGFGFHRYSTDRRWFVPHFEKMLYDQALLVTAYVEAFQATGDEALAGTAREIITYILRDMTGPSGGFYSAEDADSEGVEGKFYLWTRAELDEVLGPEDADFAAQVFVVTAEGNYQEEASGKVTGANILYLPASVADPARLGAIRTKLLAARERRVRPHLDDKILTDWNGLMIAALAQAARALDEPAYTEAAEKAARFLLNTLRMPQGELLHRYRDGEAGIDGQLDDYAFLVHGLIDLYETTFEPEWLETAIDLNSRMVACFRDATGGGFYSASAETADLLVRQKPVYDGAVPSGNSVAMLNLLRLARLTGDTGLETLASSTGNAFAGTVGGSPSAYTQLMAALDFAIGPTREVVIVGTPGGADTRALLDEVRRVYDPHLVALFLPMDGTGTKLRDLAPFADSFGLVKGKAAAYVCVNYECKLPVTDPADLRSLLAPEK